MADASLVVRVRSVGERKLKEIRRDLDRISVSATAASASLKAFGKSYTTEMNKRLNAMSKGYKRHFDELDSMIKATGRLLSKGPLPNFPIDTPNTVLPVRLHFPLPLVINHSSNKNPIPSMQKR